MKTIFAVCVGIAILGIANARAVEDEVSTCSLSNLRVHA